MADLNLKKLSRAELLEMMIEFSEEAESAKRHEKELKEEFEREKLQLQHEMAEERAAMLKSFDDEKAEMRTKFNEQKTQMQAKFDKDIEGLKSRLDKEKKDLVQQVDDKMSKIQSSGTLAEASLKLGGIFDAGQKAADLYVQTIQDQAKREYEDFKKQMVESRRRMDLMESEAKRRCEEMINAAGGDGKEMLKAILDSMNNAKIVAKDSSKTDTTEGQAPKEETAQAETISEETAKEAPKAKKTTKSNTETDNATQTDAPPVKRKRGRPRKIRVDE